MRHDLRADGMTFVDGQAVHAAPDLRQRGKCHRTGGSADRSAAPAAARAGIALAGRDRDRCCSTALALPIAEYQGRALRHLAPHAAAWRRRDQAAARSAAGSDHRRRGPPIALHADTLLDGIVSSGGRAEKRALVGEAREAIARAFLDGPVTLRFADGQGHHGRHPCR